MNARTPDTMSEAIALSSPSGRMSKRARAEANERLRVALFGPEGLRPPTPPKEDERTRLLRQAAQLRQLASWGMSPRKFTRQADALEQQAGLEAA